MENKIAKMDGNLKAALAVISTSIFWLFIMSLSSDINQVGAYRLGYGEGKAGLPERWQYFDFSLI